MNKYKYYEAKGSKYRGQLKKIKKSTNLLQPIFEVITNSLESIKSSNLKKGKIEIYLDFGGNLFSDDNNIKNLKSIEILDNGIGFIDDSFERMEYIHDDTKGYSK
jgi:nitrogen fixation/metabolism regulation signal transduction histidine kinase